MQWNNDSKLRVVEHRSCMVVHESLVCKKEHDKRIRHREKQKAFVVVNREEESLQRVSISREKDN